MKSFQEIFDEVLEPTLNNLKSQYGYQDVLSVANEVSERYARQCCEDVLNRAAENAEVDYTNNDGGGYVRTYHVDKESITSTEIVLP